MIKKPEKYDEIEVNQDFEKVELGGHKAVIMEAIEYTSDFTGTTSLKVSIDFDKSDKQPNYFTNSYKNDTREDKKWSNQAIKYVSLKDEENCIRMLKAFITSVENSNPGFTYDWNKEVTQLKGKKVGVVYGLEEYQNNEGKTRTIAKIRNFRSIDKINDLMQIPDVKLLDNTYMSYDDYEEKLEERRSNQEFNNSLDTDLVEIKDEDLPF